MRFTLGLCAAFCVYSFELQAGDKAVPVIAHWKLQGDVQDSGPQGLHGENHGVKFEVSKSGPKHPVGVFGGRGDFVQVPHRKSLSLGTSDFSISLKLHAAEILDDDLGDLLSKFDPVSRTGFHLSLRNNSGTASSSANSRQLQFSIDQQTEPVWTDIGRPGQSVFGFALAVHEGTLFVGTCEAGTEQFGKVFRYAGKSEWIDCGLPNKSNSVSSLVVYEGKLYAGTSKYRLAGSKLTESDNPNLGGQIHRYEGDGKWTACGQLPDREGIGGMTVYKGKLYVSSLYKPAGFFRYAGGDKWDSLPTPNDKRTECLGVFNGYLWATGYDEGHVYRFDGEQWKDMGVVGENTQTYAFAVHGGQLWVATWPTAKVYRLTKDEKWEDMGQAGMEKETMGMVVHNGKLYVGTLPGASVYRHDGGTQLTLMRQLDSSDLTPYKRVWTVAQYQGQAYWTTLPTGHIFGMETGKAVTYDRELPAGWRHIAAVKQGGALRLYVDGQKVAESTAFDPAKLDLTNDKPLQIGAGAGDYFNGRLTDVRLHGQALSDAEVAELARAH